MCFSFRIVSGYALPLEPNVDMLKNRISQAGFTVVVSTHWAQGMPWRPPNSVTPKTSKPPLANLFRIAERPGTVAPSFLPRVSTTASPGSGTDLQPPRDAPDSACSCPRDRVPCPGQNDSAPEGAPSQALMRAPSPCSNGPPPRRDCSRAYLFPRAATESMRRLRAGGSSGTSAARDEQRLLPVPPDRCANRPRPGALAASPDRPSVPY